MRLLLTLTFVLACGIGSNLIAQVTPPKPLPKPEVGRIVKAMSGTWTGKMTANVPGFPIEIFDWRMNCQVVAQGAGLSCTNTGKASIGSMSESCLLAFDPEDKALHYMCVSSMGEVHDHKGKWIDARTIEFEPLRAGFNGMPITEVLKWQFADVDTLDKSSEVTLPDGSVMKFEFNGKRTRILVPID